MVVLWFIVRFMILILGLIVFVVSVMLVVRLLFDSGISNVLIFGLFLRIFSFVVFCLVMI